MTAVTAVTVGPCAVAAIALLGTVLTYVASRRANASTEVGGLRTETRSLRSEVDLLRARDHSRTRWEHEVYAWLLEDREWHIDARREIRRLGGGDMPLVTEFPEPPAPVED